MIKEALKRSAQAGLMAKPHTVRFLGSSREPHPLPNGHKAVESAKWLNAAERHPDRVLAVVDGPAFTDLTTLREAWEEGRPRPGFIDRRLYDLIVALVAYGEREAFRDAVLRSPYYGEQLKKPELSLALRAELETFLSQ